MKKKSIVIVGGGFAGIRLALDLEKHVYKDADITLIDATGFHEYTPNYYRIATAPLSEIGERIPASFNRMRDQISIPISEIISTAKIKLVVERVMSIDAKASVLKLESGRAVNFDWLVLAAGSATRFFDIPRLSEFAYALKSAEDAFNIRNAIHELFSRAGKHEGVRIVIGGGGFTGSEFAASLLPYVRRLALYHGHPSSNVSVTIIEASNKIMGGANSWISEKAEKRLRELGVKIILSNPIVSVSQKEINLKNGQPVKHDILIWAAGVAANSLALELIGAKFDDNACLIVDDRLRVTPYENIFAAGDMAFCSSVEKIGSSMTARVAIQQGRFLAHTLKRVLHKRATFTYYFHKSKLVVPLGGKYVLVDLGWLRFSGFLGWCLKCLISLHYLTTILPWSKAVRRWKAGM